MRGVRAVALLMSVVFGCASLLCAQEKKDIAAAKPEAFYKLVFRVIQTSGDGTTAKSQFYSQVVSDEQNGNRIRTGDKLPMETSSSASSSGSGAISTQFQYVDLGTQIDTHGVKEVDGSVHAHVTVKLSSIGKPGTPGTMPNEPVIRECQWDSAVTVPTGKPTIIFSSDNPSDKGKTELELTATPIR